ncbi:hypothetical protein OESDEN_07736 [Oesophagostomum dentatum]|uniref:Uncharacterized protein n=1 Tax=Oesophagostomum dentatum TaxID=61180 RepID=A0A0B1T985_OESDE|nr:hypothetical protein OESDEN_07736 [Oesophagostomum dentatum]
MRVGVKYPKESNVLAAVRVFAQFLRWMQTESLHIAMSPTSAEVEQMLKIVPSSQRFSCKSFGIETKNPALVKFFLRHLQPGCSLVINEYTQLDGDECILDHEFFDSDIAKLSPCMSFNGMTEVTDDQLLHLQADTVFLVGRHITSRAVNQIILEWFEGKRKIVQMFFDAIQNPSEEEVLANLDPECFRTAEELLDIVTEVSQWRVRELSRPWVGVQNKIGMAMIVKVGKHSCSLINLDLK